MLAYKPLYLRRLVPFAFALGAFALALPAAADHRPHKKHRYDKHYRHHDRHAHHDRYHDHDRCERHHRYDTGHQRFVIPDFIDRHDDRYDDYYVGRTWYRPHRHRHAVFAFPVWRHDRYVNRDFYYCDGRRYHPRSRGHVGYHGRRVYVGIDW